MKLICFTWKLHCGQEHYAKIKGFLKSNEQNRTLFWKMLSHLVENLKLYKIDFVQVCQVSFNFIHHQNARMS